MLSAVHVHRIDGVALVVADGELDIVQAARLRAAVRDALAGTPDVVIDLETVTFLDAAIAGVLAQQVARARSQDRQLRVVGATGLVLEVLEILDLAEPLSAGKPRSSAPARPATACCQPGLAASTDPDDDNSRRFPNELIHSLLAEASALDPGDPWRQRQRARAIEAGQPAAHRLASRYFGRGENAEDLLQVASLALVSAVDGYDPGRPTSFADYAIPTILGALRRHFRDKGPAVRGPRRLQELRLHMVTMRETLTHELRHEPSTGEIAAGLGEPESEILEVLKLSAGYRPASLSAPMGEDSVPLSELLGSRDPGFDWVEYRAVLPAAFGRLPERSQRILSMRFYHEMKQAEIAAELGVSQMQVSRLIRQALGALRSAVLDHS